MKKKVAGVTLDDPQTSLHCRLFPFELVSEYRDRVFCRLSSVMRTTFLAEMSFSSFLRLERKQKFRVPSFYQALGRNLGD